MWTCSKCFVDRIWSYFVWSQITFGDLKIQHILLLYTNVMCFVHNVSFHIFVVLKCGAWIVAFIANEWSFSLDMVYHSKYFHVMFYMCDNNDSISIKIGMCDTCNKQLTCLLMVWLSFPVIPHTILCQTLFIFTMGM